MQTPKKKLLKKKLKLNNQKLKRLQAKMKKMECDSSKKKCVELLSRHLTGPALQFVTTQVMLSNRKVMGLRWLAKDKALALSLYHASPKCYRVLGKIFQLPTKQTLCRLLRSVEVYPGFPTQILNAFREKVKSLELSDKKCAILFDEMSLKSAVSFDSRNDCVEGFEDLGPMLGRTKYVGTSALVFMARGLNSKWKQPIGYFITSSTVRPEVLKLLLLCAIDTAIDVGLSPAAILCDQGSNNRSCYHKQLGVTVDDPVFTYKGYEMACFYDPPHLLKNVRNNLKENGFTVGGNSIRWQHVVDFYKQDCTLAIRCAPKLTNKHMDVPGFSTMRVRLAAQVLSHSVAKGISLFSSLNLIPAECTHTAKFCEFFDSLFNCFNSATLKSGKPYNHAVSVDSDHWAFLDQAKVYLKEITPLKRQSLPCLQGWLQNINALKVLLRQVGSEHLFTRRLNQDCLENLFFQVRNKGGSRDNPDAQQFRACIRDLMVCQIMDTSCNKNCEDDTDHFLLNLKSITGPASTGDVRTTVTSNVKMLEDLCHQSFSLTDHDYSLFDFTVSGSRSLQQANTLTYIGGFIARRVGANTKLCKPCTSVLVAEADVKDPVYQLIELKQHKGCTTGLTYPSAIMIDLLQEAETVYGKVVNDVLHMKNVRKTLLACLGNECYTSHKLHCDKCSISDAVLMLFINIRLHHSLKLISLGQSQSRKARCRKLMKLSNL